MLQMEKDTIFLERIHRTHFFYNKYLLSFFAVISFDLIEMINILSFNIPYLHFQKNNNSLKIKFLVLEGFGGVPPIRPLETLHNALSLRQLDTFLEKMTTTTIFKTPASSPPKYPSTPLLTPTQTPHNSLTEKPGPMTCKLRKDVKNEEAEQKLPETDDANSF